jgi:hypothetical protein
VTKTIESDDPATVIDHIKKNGGVAVFAHPTARNYPVEKEWIMLLDGAEIWNRHEGKYLPPVKSLERFRKFKRWHPGLMAFCGLDMHVKANFYPISTIVRAYKNERGSLLDSLKKGDFTGVSRRFQVGSDGRINCFKRLLLYPISLCLEIIRDTKNSVFDN